MKTHGPGCVAGRMECDSGDLADQQLLLILEPVVGHRNRHIGDTEHPTLHFEMLPQLKIILMQANRRPCRFLHFARSEKMVEVGMGVENVADGESELMHLVENSLVRPTGIDDDGLLRHWIADDRTVATKGRDGKGFSDHGGHHGRMLPSKPIRAQAAVPLLVLPEPEWPKRLPYRITSSFLLDGETTRGIPLRCRPGVVLRHTAMHHRSGGFAPRVRRPDDPGPRELEPVAREPP